MRFDDMIATVLAQDELRAPAMVAKWRQLVDLLAQRRGRDASEQAKLAESWLRRKRSAIPFGTRQEIARSLAGRKVSPNIVTLFAEDHPAVAAPLIGGVRLDAHEWLEMLPSLSPVSRALLRHRRDLDRDVVHALASFGASDFAISGTIAEAPPLKGDDRGQIRELVERIEAFRKQNVRLPPSPQSESIHIEAFRWETGSDGIISWVEDAPRGPLIGQSIATAGEHGQFGVDGQAAGAFEKRAPFRDARFSVAGAGAASGAWRISGVPFFDHAHGNFLGYRGTARRPRLDEVARPEGKEEMGSGLFGSDLPADSLRQLIHELRTPLNAIVGFAEMIDGQYMGPAAGAYRSRAAEIMEQATRLLSAVDDLDTAARIETSRLILDQSSVDAVAVICRLHEAYARIADQRNSRISIEIAPGLPPAKVELQAAERMFARLLAATIGLAREGETIAATMDMGHVGGREMLCLAIDRPKAIHGLAEKALLDPGYSPDGDWPGAPALGLGFALRLVRNLAEAVGGALLIGDARFLLYLPPLEAAELSPGQEA